MYREGFDQAEHRIGSKTLKKPASAPILWAIAATNFVALYNFAVPFPIIVLGAALWLLPMLALVAWSGWHSALAQMGWFFTKAALLLALAAGVALIRFKVGVIKVIVLCALAGWALRAFV